MRENIFVTNLKEIYKSGQVNLFLIKRMAKMDVRFGDMTESDYEELMLWLDAQEEEIEVVN